MRQNNWLLRLAVLATSTLLAPFAQAGEDLVPFDDEMTEGQGFNTFLRQGCMHNAVEVSEVPNPGPPAVEVAYFAEKMTSYEKFVDLLDISAGGSIKALNKGGSFSAKFLDKNEFESSFLTYLVKVDIRRQSTPKKTFKLNNIGILNNTQTTYCDRFISGFVEGGALYARVSIMTSDKTKQREVEQAAEIAFTAYGAEVAVNQKVKSNMERVQKNTNIKVHLHYVGTPSEMKGPAVESKDDELLQVKMRADAFLADAQKHNWKRFARLERYDTIQGFNKFTPIDYSGAIDRSWSVFHDYQSYLSAQHMIRNIPAEKYIGGREIRDQLDDRSSNALETIRNWVSSVNANPSRAKTKPQVENPSRFQGELVSTVQTTRYIGQRLYLRNGGTTDIIDTTLRPRAKQLFVIDAYDFPKIPGTANLIFAGKSNGDQYEVVIGREKTPGYETLRELWVFQKPIRGVVDMAVTVTVIPDGPIITLDYKNPERIFVPVRRALPTTQMSRFFRRQDLTLFSFYVNPVLAKAPA